MARYEINASIGTYQHYVAEAESAEEAESRAIANFEAIIEDEIEHHIIVGVTEVPDDTELGDCSG